LIELGARDVRRLNWHGAKPIAARLLSSFGINQVAQLAARAVLPTRLRHRLPLARRHVDYSLADGNRVRLLDPLHDTIARDIHWGGAQPTDPAERLKLRTLELLSKSAATFLDVGAYAGLYALIAARSNPELKAIAYEIVPENYLLTVRNILENDLARRVEAKLRGIGEREGTLRLPAQMRAASHLSSISLGSRFDAGVAVPVSTLDAETRGLAAPFLMKIDVEGFEEQVFLGGKQFIRTSRPDIICEILPADRAPCATIEAMVRPLGYRTFTFEADGVAEHPTIAPRPTLRDWLITARPQIDDVLGGFLA
jgi:FkbM family methyltransferase